jgi:hypothetical protein
MSILATRGLKGKGFLRAATLAWRGGLSGGGEEVYQEVRREFHKE